MAGLEAHIEDFDEAGVEVVALSADDEEGARTMQEEEDLSFPILYGLDVEEMRDKLGLYIEKGQRTHLQPAQFILDAEGTISLACYSSGKVGRLDADEALAEAREAA